MKKGHQAGQATFRQLFDSCHCCGLWPPAVGLAYKGAKVLIPLEVESLEVEPFELQPS